MSQSQNERRYLYGIILVISAITLWRAIFLFISPLQLSPDEAYYWDWSRRLDFGYFSKPPLIAWIIWLSTKILGNTEFGVRFPTVVLGTLSLIIISRLLYEVYNIKSAFYGVLLSISIPATTLLSYVMTIDAPLVFFWTLSIYLFWKAINSERIIWWILLGLSNGLGLLSKQTMAGFFMGMFLFLLLNREKRHLLYSFKLYISLIISFVLFLPVIIWNYNNDWVTLIHTSEHFTRNSGYDIAERMKDFLEFILSQMLIISPVLVPFFLVSGFRDFMKIIDINRFYFASFSIPFLYMVLILAVFKTINANWVAPFYIGSIILTAGLFFDENIKNLTKFKTKLINFAIVLGIFLVILFYSIPFLVSPLGIKNTKYDPTRRLTGFRELAKEVEKTILEKGLINEKFNLASTRRKYVSSLAFYFSGNPIVYRWTEIDYPTTQYEIWDMWKDKRGENFLFVLEEREKITHKMLNSFEEFNEISGINVENRKFKVYYAKGFKGKN